MKKTTGNLNNTVLTEETIKKMVDNLQEQDIIKVEDINDQVFKSSLQQVSFKERLSLLDSLPTELILDVALMKQGRKPKNGAFHKNVIDYMTRQSVSIYNVPLEKKEEKDPNWMDNMKEQLIQIPGVMKIDVLLDDYPEHVSMILKIDMSCFDDDEALEYMGKIETIIPMYKPKELQELEMIYHNKVVYE